jgi:hypothetical protein
MGEATEQSRDLSLARRAFIHRPRPHFARVTGASTVTACMVTWLVTCYGAIGSPIINRAGERWVPHLLCDECAHEISHMRDHREKLKRLGIEADE